VALWGVDWVKATERLWEAVAFCGRYGHQPVDHVRHWPRSQVIRMARHFETFVRNENRRPSKK
jgi:hypothetical protein